MPLEYNLIVEGRSLVRCVKIQKVWLFSLETSTLQKSPKKYLEHIDCQVIHPDSNTYLYFMLV